MLHLPLEDHLAETPGVGGEGGGTREGGGGVRGGAEGGVGGRGYERGQGGGVGECRELLGVWVVGCTSA